MWQVAKQELRRLLQEADTQVYPEISAEEPAPSSEASPSKAAPPAEAPANSSRKIKRKRSTEQQSLEVGNGGEPKNTEENPEKPRKKDKPTPARSAKKVDINAASAAVGGPSSAPTRAPSYDDENEDAQDPFGFVRGVSKTPSPKKPRCPAKPRTPKPTPVKTPCKALLDKFDAVAPACATPKSSAAKKGKGFGAMLALPAPPKDMSVEESESERIRKALGHLVLGGSGGTGNASDDDHDDDLVFVASESWLHSH